MNIFGNAIHGRNSSAQHNGALHDYIALTKPTIVLMQLVTTLAAMVIASDAWPRTDLVFWTLLGGALCAGGASAFNQYIDRETDGLMARTSRRPLPQGRVKGSNVVLLGLLSSTFGVIILALFVNPLSASLALSGILYYVIFYSLILKPSTPQNIVIGGGAGAIPPLVGWAAATGELNVAAFFLCAVVFFWTPPHFWALALTRKQDYLRAGIPMLPVALGDHATRWHILLYTIQVVALTLLLPVVRLGGWIYLASALAFGSGLIYHAWRVFHRRDDQATLGLYHYSNQYLALIFASLVLDTLV